MIPYLLTAMTSATKTTQQQQHNNTEFKDIPYLIDCCDCGIVSVKSHHECCLRDEKTNTRLLFHPSPTVSPSFVLLHSEYRFCALNSNGFLTPSSDSGILYRALYSVLIAILGSDLEFLVQALILSNKLSV